MIEPEKFIERLELVLKETLPGTRSQQKMAPEVRLENRFDSYRNAAVLILLYRKEGAWHLVLMRRTEYAGAHSRQVSLPGGIHEKEDPDMAATALRETREELGIDEGEIRLLGGLSKLSIPVSGIEVSPFVGFYPGTPEFHPDSSEVDYLIEVPLSELLEPENIRTEHRTILCRVVRVPYFDLAGEKAGGEGSLTVGAGGEKVWGATAMILSEFLDLVRRLEEAGPG